MTGFISKLFKHKVNPLNAINIYEKIEFYAEQLLKADKQIIADEKWRQASHLSINIYDQFRNMYLFEREILCLASLSVGLSKELKNDLHILKDTISLMIKNMKS